MSHHELNLEKSKAVLIDTTKCVGCRACQVSCKQFYDLKPTKTSIDGKKKGLTNLVTLDANNRCLVTFNEVDDAKSPNAMKYVMAKRQCMHCDEPACASACPVTAMEKTAEGPVKYDAEKCIGCRYCMWACPFGVPTAEWDSLAPKINKCTMCFERCSSGDVPAERNGVALSAEDQKALAQKYAVPSCVKSCPPGALEYGDRQELLKKARAQARVWQTRAPALFDVDVPAARARAAVGDYARGIGVNPQPALNDLGEAPLSFHALSLDEQGAPISILHSDEGFRLLLTEPSPSDVARCLDAILRPFPAGLMTDAGLVVANPALASADLQREFTRFAYHGTVIWSWQQALLAAGIQRQLRRADLPEALRADLARAHDRLWAVIEQTRSMRTSELWSWSYANGRIHAEPFGRPGADVDESNAAQLWSTVYLGLSPAATAPATRDTSSGN